MNIPFLSRVRTIYDNRSEPEYVRAFADIFWRSLLVLAVLVLGAAIVIGTAMFLQARSEIALDDAAPAALTATSSSTFSRTSLDTTVAALHARVDAFGSLQSGEPLAIPDPSQ